MRSAADKLVGYRNALQSIESLIRVASSACRAEESAADIHDVGRAIEAATSDLMDVIGDMTKEIGEAA